MKKLLLALLLVSLPVNADVLNRSVNLISVTNRTTTITSSVVDLNGYDLNSISGVACQAVAANDSGTTPTLDIIVQTCSDAAGTVCDTICTFTQCTTGNCWTDASSTIDLGTTTNLYRYIKSTATLAGTSPQYDVTVNLFFGTAY